MAAHRDNVKGGVANSANLSILIVHEVDEVCRNLCGGDNLRASGLMSSQLVENIHYLQYNFIILLLGCW